MDFVARQNVKHVFMLVGGGAMHLNDSLGRAQGFVMCATCMSRPAPSPPKPIRA